MSSSRDDTCPKCSAALRRRAQFCHRCGRPLHTTGVWVLGAMSGGWRPVAKAALRHGTLRRSIPLFQSEVFLDNLSQAFFEALKRFDPASTIHLISGAGRRYVLVAEGAGLIARFTVSQPYAHIELRGPRDVAQSTVRRVVARCGAQIFAPRHGNWKLFTRCTNVDEAHNRATLGDLLA